MSQYGAYGQALAGRTYDQILAYYYTGTELGKRAGRRCAFSSPKVVAR